jgi:glycosyltransferase involved in cell wall biosynthesis
MADKKKILMLSDHPLSTSGVGVQSRYLIQGLIATGRYSFRCFGGAVKHDSYNTVKVTDDFVIKPTNGFGDKNLLRMTLAVERPDVLLLFTDPRFFIWVWEMEDEIHQICPIAYNHLWDNPPWPEFNRVLYESTDLVNCINYPTYEMVHQRFPEKTHYVPHAVPSNLFTPLPADERKRLKQMILGKERLDHFVVLYVSRNARRKMPSDIIISFKQFLDALEKKEGHRKGTLVMHTDPMDPEGPNLHHVIDMLHLKEHIVFSKDRIGFEQMNALYNIGDTIVNRSCFVAGTKVSTDKGLRSIETLVKGDHVITHTGQLKPIVRTMTTRTEGLVRIRVTNNDPVVCTPEHPTWAIKRSKLRSVLAHIPGNRKALIRDHITATFVHELAEFISARDLQKGDLCVYSVAKPQVTTSTFDLTQYISPTTYAQHTVLGANIVIKSTDASKHHRGDTHCAPAHVALTPALAYVMGNWIADGTTNTFSIAFNSQDIEKMLLLEHMLLDSFGARSIRSKERSNCICVNPVNGEIIARFMNDVCGKYSDGKHVPSFMLGASEKVKRAFVDGLMAGDGCTLTHNANGTKMHRYRTVSPALAQGLKDVLASLGYCVSMSDDDNSHGYNHAGRIWCLEWRNRRGGYNGSCRSWNVGGQYVLETVTSTTFFAKNVPVYNLEVQGDNTYRLAGITVHNCNEGFGLPTLEMMMAAKPIIALKTGGLTRQVENYETKEQYGIALEPEVRTLVGNQQVPYIFEDFVSHETVAKAYMKLYEMGPEGRDELGARCRIHALKDYDINKTIGAWDTTLTNLTDGWREGKRPPRWEKVEI